MGLSYSSNNTVSNNLILKNRSTTFNMTTDGVRLDSATANRIVNNTMSNNLNSIIALLSSANQIYHNNFINNTILQEYIEGGNIWDDGYPSGGNYWSDYTGVDLYHGPNQNEIGSDGIGDTPYNITAEERDRYPLMNPFMPP
jgi:parallel beta-helix repeat protein